MHSVRRLPIIVVLLMVLGGVIGMSIYFRSPPTRSPLTALPTGGAVEVFSLGPFFTQIPSWLNDHTLLIFRSVNNALNTISERDVKTGREIRLRGLEKRQVPFGSLQISPDGKHLLWYEGGVQPFFSAGSHHLQGNSFIPAIIHTTSLQGDAAQTHSWTQSFFPKALLWLNDSRHFMEIDAAHSVIIVHDILHPSVVQRRKPNHPHDLDQISGVMKITRGDRLVCMAHRNGPYSVVPYAEIFVLPLTLCKDHGTLLGPLQHHKIIFPPYAHLCFHDEDDGGIAFSPMGNKVGWWLKLDDDPPLSLSGSHLQMLVRNGIDGQTVRWDSPEYAPLWLWVCNTDGSGLHTVGKLRAARKIYAGGGEGGDSGAGLQWLPDSKHLSFEYHDSIWVVPAN